MSEDGWLAVVVGVSGVVALVAVALVLRSVRPQPSPRSPRLGSSSAGQGVPDEVPGLSEAPRFDRRAWAFRSFGPWHRPRSVEHNLQRALSRIDAVDPYVVPRRIGSALAEAGLSPEPAGDTPSRQPTSTADTGHTWPFGPLRGRHEGED